jgi:putative redox protein
MIHTESQPDRFLTRFTNGEQTASSDTTPDKGGGSRGFRPHELLEAALATCMNMSLRMYAQKHDIPLSGASVSVSLDRNTPEGPTFVYRIQLHGSLSDVQKSHLLSSIESCPVRTTLSKGLRFARAID